MSNPLLLVCAATIALSTQPENASVEWLRTHGVPFTGVRAGTGFDDLEPLREIIGDARIVSLGEGTHGTREFFQMKHRLLEFLATELGFDIFSIEASMPDAYRLNDYVLHGEGNPRTLIREMRFWTWSTEEVLALVEWMRAFNREGRGRLQFTGFDMQFPQPAMQNVLAFVREHSERPVAEVEEPYEKLSNDGAGTGTTFGVVTATFPIETVRGKRVVYSGYIRTENVTDGYAGLWWRADGSENEVLAFDNMAGRGPHGTTDWSRFEVSIAVPGESSQILFGLLMPGYGKAWFDSLAIEIDGEAYEGPTPFDFDFESDALDAYTRNADFDREVVKDGEQSLRMERVAPAGAKLEPREAQFLAQEVANYLQLRRRRNFQDADPDDFEWALQNARLVVQAMEMTWAGGSARDRSMAKNVQWIAEQNPSSKLVLWAHNGHVTREDRRMGAHLDRSFGDSHLPVAFATSRGHYAARNSVGDGPGVFELAPPTDGSVEWLLSATKAPRLILDLRQAVRNSQASGWLYESTRLRGIGAIVVDGQGQFRSTRPAEDFDVIIFIEETSPAVPLSP